MKVINITAKACQDIQGHSIFQSISSCLASNIIFIYPFRCISMSLQNESSLSFHACNHRKGWEHTAIEVTKMFSCCCRLKTCSVCVCVSTSSFGSQTPSRTLVLTLTRAVPTCTVFWKASRKSLDDSDSACQASEVCPCGLDTQRIVCSASLRLTTFSILPMHPLSAHFPWPCGH